MRHISLISLFVGLNDLLSKRLAALQASSAGAATVKILGRKRDAMAKLPAVAAGRPLVDELAQEDDRHDSLGAAIWHLTEAYFVFPDTPEHLVAAAKKIRAAFIPTLEELGASYPAEAKAAMDRKPELVNLKTELSAFPAAGGGTLYDWAEAFLASGTKIDGLLSARADLEKQSRKEASKLRGEVVGILNRMRRNLELEVEDDADLPRDLEAQVFGYFDMLEKSAAEAAAKGRAGQDTPPPAPEGSSEAPQNP